MPLKDILVHLEASEAADARLGLAIGLARRHGAHLAGLHVVEVMMPVAVVPDASGIGLGEMYAQLRDVAFAGAAEVERGFRARMAREGMAGEWRQVEGIGRETLATHARYADLLVLGQEEPGRSTGLVEAAIFGAGRPVLVVPHAGTFPSVGERVLVAWNGGREAARAVHDALPLLVAAQSVTVLAVNPRGGVGPEQDLPAADLALHLARHGVRATADHRVAPGVEDAEVLLNAVAESGADLVVMGAYGHSRLREMVMGGVTRTLLRSMTVPVLLSH